MKARKVTLFAEGLKFPEGPAFDRWGNLFAVNIDTAGISKISPRGEVKTFVNTGGVPNGARFHANGDLYIADRIKGIIAISPEGQISTIVDNYRGKAFNGPNDLIFDYDGNLYFTDPHGSSAENPMGKVYRVSAAGEINLLAEGLAYPNGLVISADGRDLLVAITRKNRVHRYVLDSAGIPYRSTIFAQLSGGWGPDGMALDVDGNLYIAHVGGGKCSHPQQRRRPPGKDSGGRRPPHQSGLRRTGAQNALCYRSGYRIGLQFRCRYPRPAPFWLEIHLLSKSRRRLSELIGFLNDRIL